MSNDTMMPAELSRAERAIAAADTIDAIKEIVDVAEAYRVFAKTADEQNIAATVKLKASAKGGTMLADDPKLGRGKSARLAELFDDLTDRAAQNVSRRWQRIASLDELGTLDAYLDGQPDEISMAGLFAYATIGALNSSESPEWYTPDKYLDAARQVLGRIDLDPASCESANATVKAKKYYTALDDGLSKPWHGRVFLNPPYGKSAPKGNALFIPKLVEEFEVGRTKAAIVLTSAHSTDTEWFQVLWEYTLCFTDHRVPYWNDDGIGMPTFGSVFTYLGPDPDAFAERFAEFGAIVERRQ